MKEKKDIVFDLNTKETFTFMEAVAYTGLSRSYLYKLTGGKRIPHYKPTGNKIYFDRKELDGWLKSVRISTDSEIREMAMAHKMS